MTTQNYTTNDFFAKYKNPQWQRRRLEVMQSRGFKCELCGSSDSELHVHHKYYVRGRDPWEYEISELSCLCKMCHTETHADSEALDDAIRAYKRDGGSLSYLAGLIDAHNGGDNRWSKEVPVGIDAGHYIEGFTFGMQPGATKDMIMAAKSMVDADGRIDYFVFCSYFSGLSKVAEAVVKKRDLSKYPDFISEKIKAVAGGGNG